MKLHCRRMFALGLGEILIVLSLGCAGEMDRTVKEGNNNYDNDNLDAGFVITSHDGGGNNNTSPKADIDKANDAGVAIIGDAKGVQTNIDSKPSTTQENGCYLLNKTCKDHPEFGRPEKFFDIACRDKGKGEDIDCCRSRAAEVAYWCGNDNLSTPFPKTIATYEVGGTLLGQKEYQTGDACLICFSDCPADKVFYDMLPKKDNKGCTHDYIGYLRSPSSDKNKDTCYNRVRDYLEYCKKGTTTFWVWGGFYKGWIMPKTADGKDESVYLEYP